MSTITIELDNLTEEEQETVKKLAKKRNAPYVPEKGEKYFYVNENGNVYVTTNNGSNYNIFIGNCFRTKEEAEEAITRLQMQTKWKRLSLEAGEADNPWDGYHPHWFAEYECIKKEFLCNNSSFFEFGIVYFPTIESISDAINELGEDNVKKYILGVNDGR